VGTTDAEDTTLPDTAGEDTTTTAPDTKEADVHPDGGADNTVLWIALIACGVIAAACIVVVVVVIAKNKKK